MNENEIVARIDAVACYISQLRGLFPSQFERIQEIVQARFGFFKHIRFHHDLATSRKRMESSLREYVSRNGGERYWFRAGSNTRDAIFSETTDGHG
jgi:hypothetical protein